MVVRFHPLPRMQSTAYQTVDIELSSKHTYDQFTAKVAARLDVNPTHIRFYSVNAANGNPKAPIKRNPSTMLAQVLKPPYSTYGGNNQRSDSLYYEVLEISLSELDTKKSLKVTWLSEGTSKDVCIRLESHVLIITNNFKGIARCTRSQSWYC